MKKIAIIFVFGVMLAVIGWQAYKLERSREELASEYLSAQTEFNHLTSDNQSLSDEIKYYSDPHNLEKELRAKFNYLLPGEKMIIVVPQTNQTSTSQ
ncbi:MAG TPA: septum formation initiator family protein [Candidatus Tyrphobacter sp.]|nr:septum formation initiator family protein [Candidatus Tyrphobacter sp.]